MQDELDPLEFGLQHRIENRVADRSRAIGEEQHVVHARAEIVQNQHRVAKNRLRDDVEVVRRNLPRYLGLVEQLHRRAEES